MTSVRVVDPPQLGSSTSDPFEGMEVPERAGYLRDFLRLGPSTLIGTGDLRRCVLVVSERTPIPVVVNDGGEEDCYLLSPYAHYVKYMLIELRKISGFRTRILRGVVDLLGRISLPLGFNRCVSVNNWLLTTNPELRLGAEELARVTDLLARRHPDHAIVFRTVDARDADTRRAFTDAGYKLVINRPVHGWLPDGLKKGARSNIRKDLRLLDDPRFEIAWPGVLAPGEEERIHQLYSALYVHKHAGYNCRYTARFFRSAHDSGLFQFAIVRGEGRILAFFTSFEESARTMLSLIGYDTALDRTQFPLYRLCIARALKSGIDRRRELFFSTGAANFKQTRGCVEWMEHEAVYDRHLPRHRRIPWSLFQAALDAGTDGLDTSQI